MEIGGGFIHETPFVSPLKITLKSVAVAYAHPPTNLGTSTIFTFISASTLMCNKPSHVDWSSAYILLTNTMTTFQDIGCI